MRFRSHWSKQTWGHVVIKLILGPIRVFAIDIDVYRNFYSITFLNFTLRNR